MNCEGREGGQLVCYLGSVSYYSLRTICFDSKQRLNLWPVKGFSVSYFSVLTKSVPFFKTYDIQCTIVFVFNFYNNKTAAVKINRGPVRTDAFSFENA